MIHGKASSYRNHRCRCPECTEAHRLAMEAWKASKPEVFQHGFSAYCNQGCRCEVCTLASSEHWRQYQASRKAAS